MLQMEFVPGADGLDKTQTNLCLVMTRKRVTKIMNRYQVRLSMTKYEEIEKQIQIYLFFREQGLDYNEALKAFRLVMQGLDLDQAMMDARQCVGLYRES